VLLLLFVNIFVGKKDISVVYHVLCLCSVVPFVSYLFDILLVQNTIKLILLLVIRRYQAKELQRYAYYLPKSKDTSDLETQ